MAGIVEKETNFYLYKIIDKDELVYIGKSTNIDNRIEVHSVINNHFDKNMYFICRGESISNLVIYIANVPDEYLLSIYEITLISKYKPVYNNSDKYDTKHLLKLPQINWVPYVSKENCEAIYNMKTGKVIDPCLIDTPLKRWNILKDLHMEEIKC